MSEVIDQLKLDLYQDEFQGYDINSLLGETQQHPIKKILNESKDYTKAAEFLKNYYQSEESILDIQVALKPCLRSYVSEWFRDYVDGDPEPTLLFLERMPRNCQSLTTYADHFADWFVDQLGLSNLADLKLSALSEVYEFVSDNASEFLKDPKIRQLPLSKELQIVQKPEFKASLVSDQNMSLEMFQRQVAEGLNKLNKPTHKQTTEQSQTVHQGRSR